MSSCTKKKKRFSGKMLNLKVGSVYKITTFLAGEYTVKVTNKSVHFKTTHTYWCNWPDPVRGTKVGRYFWDNGEANQGRTIVYDIHGISTCEEVNENDLCPYCYSMKVDPCGRGGWRCIECSGTYGAD